MKLMMSRLHNKQNAGRKKIALSIKSSFAIKSKKKNDLVIPGPLVLNKWVAANTKTKTDTPVSQSNV